MGQVSTGGEPCERVAARNIVIVHSIPLIRLGLVSIMTESTLLSNYDVSAFITFAEAVSTVLRTKTNDVIIFDTQAWLAMQSSENFEIFDRVKAQGSSLGLITSTHRGNLSWIDQEGLSCLISLEADSGDIVTVIKDLANHHQSAAKTRLVNFSLPPRPTLTSKQRSILKLVAEGLSNKQIATKLGMRDSTVKHYMSQLFKKFGRHRRTELIAVVMQNP